MAAGDTPVTRLDPRLASPLTAPRPNPGEAAMSRAPRGLVRRLPAFQRLGRHGLAAVASRLLLDLLWRDVRQLAALPDVAGVCSGFRAMGIVECVVVRHLPGAGLRRASGNWGARDQYARVMGVGASLTLVAMASATLLAVPLVALGGYALTGWVSVGVCRAVPRGQIAAVYAGGRCGGRCRCRRGALGGGTRRPDFVTSAATVPAPRR